MKPIQETKYFMEDPREKQRLADKVDPDSWAQQYIFPLLDAESEVLDVGCGPCVLAKAVASQAKQVTGLERSDDRYAEAGDNLSNVSNAKVVQGSATKMPFESDQFGLVYTRFMLEYLKEREKAVSEMVRVCKPGGQVMLQDLDGQLVWHYPVEAELADKINTVVATLEESGFDPFLGRKLFYMAKSGGLVDVTVTCEPYHFYAGKIDDKNFDLWNLKLDIALPIIAKALGSESEATKYKSQFMDYLCREDTFTYSNVFTVVGTKPA